MRKFLKASKSFSMISSAVVFSAVLAGCTTTASPQLICPEIPQYTVEQQAAVAAELLALIQSNAAPTTRLFVIHYRQMRARMFAAGCK